MDTSKMTIKKALLAAGFAGTLGLLSALPAVAQSVPSYAAGAGDETISGTVAAVNGSYNISVRDARGFVDNVSLHQGTIINPTGLSLAPGLTVTIMGTNEGSTFAANEIDTPYTSLVAVPVYPGFYGAYPYRPVYNVGIGFGRGFRFGFRG
jgi:hypothetical protein